VVGGLALLSLLAVLDFVLPRGGWYADHPMSAAALSSLVGFLAAGLCLEGWLKEREGRRLDRISTVAYRSLAQFANDAGRSLLAPLNGADLYALAIPGARAEDVVLNRATLTRVGHGPQFDEATGSWQCEPDQLAPALAALVAEPEFVRRMFRVTATVRRRVQEATALWAPVMLTSKTGAEDLGRLRALTDALELLQELWRDSGLVGQEPVDWEPDGDWRTATCDQFWVTITVYERLRTEFADAAALPSDALVRRRGGRPGRVPQVPSPRDGSLAVPGRV
jgi:hypothetical protein